MLLLSRFSRVGLSATPWTAAHQAPPSMGLSGQELWSGVPLPSLVYALGKQNTCVTCFLMVVAFLKWYGTKPVIFPWSAWTYYFTGGQTGILLACKCKTFQARFSMAHLDRLILEDRLLTRVWNAYAGIPWKKWSSQHSQQKSLKCSTWMQSQKWQNNFCSFSRQTLQYHSNLSLCPGQ